MPHGRLWAEHDPAKLADIQRARRSVYIQGKIVTFKLHSRQASKPPTKAKGQEIKEFSASSRLRLLKKIARIDWDKLPRGLFVTLTYPDENADADPAKATMQRHHFIRYTEKILQERLPILWCKEYIDRKSGKYTGIQVHHWHLSLFTTKRFPMHLARSAWAREIKASGYVDVDVKRMSSGEHAAFYLAKYLSKDGKASQLGYHPKLTKPGRHWGFHREELIPMHPASDFTGISEEQWNRIMEQVLAISPNWGPGNEQSFSLLGERALEAAKIVFEMMY